MMNFWIDRGGKVISQNLARIEPPHFEISRTRELRLENKTNKNFELLSSHLAGAGSLLPF